MWGFFFDVIGRVIICLFPAVKVVRRDRGHEDKGDADRKDAISDKKSGGVGGVYDGWGAEAGRRIGRYGEERARAAIGRRFGHVHHHDEWGGRDGGRGGGRWKEEEEADGRARDGRDGERGRGRGWSRAKEGRDGHRAGGRRDEGDEDDWSSGGKKKTRGDGDAAGRGRGRGRGRGKGELVGFYEHYLFLYSLAFFWREENLCLAFF